MTTVVDVVIVVIDADVVVDVAVGDSGCLIRLPRRNYVSPRNDVKF